MTSVYDFHLFDFIFIPVYLAWPLKLSTWSNHAEHLKGLAQFHSTRYPLLQQNCEHLVSTYLTVSLPSPQAHSVSFMSDTFYL